MTWIALMAGAVLLAACALAGLGLLADRALRGSVRIRPRSPALPPPPLALPGGEG